VSSVFWYLFLLANWILLSGVLTMILWPFIFAFSADIGLWAVEQRQARNVQKLEARR
jgi:hypothetical protein